MIHLIDQATCERTPLVATLVGDVACAVNEAGGASGALHGGGIEGMSRVVVMGRSESAMRAGLAADEVIACPRAALVPGGIAAMRRWVKAKGLREERGGGGPWVCWSGGCELLMSLVMGETLRIMPGDAHRVCDVRRLASGPDRVTLRQQWGVSEEQRVVVLLCDEPGGMSADFALKVVGLAAETGRPWRLLLHPATRNLSMAQHVTRKIGHGERLILDERVAVTWSVLAGCDAAMWLGSGRNAGGGTAEAGRVDFAGSGGLSLAWAMLSGVVVVSQPHPWLVHERTGWVGTAGCVRTLARLLCRVHDQAEQARQIGEAGSVWAKQRFDPAKAVTWWAELGRG